MLKAILFIPLVGAGINGLLGRRWTERWISLIGAGSVGLSASLALIVFFRDLLPLPPHSRRIFEPFYSWIDSGALHANFGFQLDALSGIYLLFVTFVGCCIHVFAIGYMRGEEGYARFFSYMNLFMFMMLLLVLADNYLLMFVGWEGVGLCSYLLIGHYFKTKVASDAAMKAFILNRIGDVGFAIGILLIFATFGSIRYVEVNELVRSQFPAAEALGSFGVLTAIALLLFIGAIGKSAQIPLFVWLPDAMAGPTPVSALIHAATMVTAGVYMVARSSEIYIRTETAMLVVAVVGGFTALFAATIAIAQSNIKKVLAYSTISQLGYMFLACGAGAFSAGIFHVVTHSFFKALLFLGAGSVILAMHHDEDLRHMGGLGRSLRTTHATLVAGWLALAGIFPFAGFFSKDEILWDTFSTHVIPPFWAKLLWFAGVATAILTAVYITRLMAMTFYGAPRFRSEPGHRLAHTSEPHESPRVMTVPLMVLAALSTLGGFVGISPALSLGRFPNWFDEFLSPELARIRFHNPHAEAQAANHGIELGLMVVTLVAAIAAIAWARRYYLKDPLWQPPSLLERKYMVDEIYDRLFVRPLTAVSTSLLWRIVDVGLIDGAVNGVADSVAAAARTLRRIQTGLVRSYAVMILFGALVLVGYFLFGGQ